MQCADIAIIGGEKDFNLIRLASYINNNTNYKLNLILIGENQNLSYHLDLNDKKLLLNGEEFSSKSVFIRADIFKFRETKNPEDHTNAQNWFQAFSAWLIAHPEIKTLNRTLLAQSYFHKANSLLIAEKHGIPIPKTFISNSTNSINEIIGEQELIYKPISGGDHAKELKEKFDPIKFKEGIVADPFFFQEKLVYPELRVFYIDGNFLSFELNSTELDYRKDRTKLQLKTIETPEYLKNKLKAVNEEIGLDFSATDLKYCSIDKCFKFLEVNTTPVFNSFDKVSDYKICSHIVNSLID
ncbi:MAG: hypothetical protein HRT47_12950 [Candidatus Caenarcaniphilales bacterium]|nr:hypothetical protein [Candidatus Caenarcaniphilales bacterium]